ncbi:MAG: phage tail protein [Leptolyngbyaceae cyanobacterium MAG.088]|nr:phage tail protein [Leptolyngbyaceae cyanobacterium MAG.088]
MTETFNYVTANRFYVEIDSQISASFSECSGIGVTLKTQSIVEGGVNGQQRFFIDNPEFSNVILKRGITDSVDFWAWIKAVLTNTSKQRRNVSILLFNQAGETMQAWTLVGAIPVGWKADALQANAESVALEELTLAYEGLKIEKGGGSDPTKGEPRDHKTGYFMGDS